MFRHEVVLATLLERENGESEGYTAGDANGDQDCIDLRHNNLKKRNDKITYLKKKLNGSYF